VEVGSRRGGKPVDGFDASGKFVLDSWWDEALEPIAKREICFKDEEQKN